MIQRLGKNQQKLLLLLLGGMALILSRSPKKNFQILQGIREEWKAIEKQNIKRAIKQLYDSRLITEHYNKDGTITLILSSKGKSRALTYNLGNMKIKKPKQWDKKWRIVLFDIPEPQKRKREALRIHLKGLEFYEFQKSVFVHPFNCKDEIEYLIEFYDIRKFVRFIEAYYIDNELHLKKHFKLV